jgi:hypothetical protein
MNFREFELPMSNSVLIPSDIELKLPEKTPLNAKKLQFLVNIPWSDKYLQYVDKEYLDFFNRVLPYLHVRTTDVHVATCIPFIKEFIQAHDGYIDEKVVYIAFILHDSGWSQMSEEEIVSSLGVTGLALNEKAISSKEKHAVLGRNIAMHVLGQEPYASQVTQQQKDLIYNAVLYHDKPWELVVNGAIPVEMKIVCDVDHLWSFTHENFWQDTVRKRVDPTTYLKNLNNDLASYFVTEKGKEKATILLHKREVEVELWRRLVVRRD